MKVVKSDGHRQDFDLKKIEQGLWRSLEKRPVSPVTVENLLHELEDEVHLKGKSNNEIRSSEIGAMILEKLYTLDHVAYIRFASVYRNFEDVNEFIDTDEKKIHWTVNLKKDLERGVEHKYKKDEIRKGIYRPFTKQQLYFDKPFIERPGLSGTYFPTSETQNFAICVSPSANDNLSVLITDQIPNLHLNGDIQAFPLYYYEEQDKQSPTLFDYANQNESEYIRRDGVSDFILTRAEKQYGKNVTKEDIFYYVYGILHSPDYRTAFANDLKKMLPRLPLVEDVRDFWKFSKAGRQLAALHIDYEDVAPYPGVLVHYKGIPKEEIEKGLDGEGMSAINYRVEKMRFPKVDGVVRGKKKKVNDKSTIHYNSQISITNIPEKAYKYVVNGKSAIEWVMERYQVKTDKKSGITNDPNDWAEEVGNPKKSLFAEAFQHTRQVSNLQFPNSKIDEVCV